MRLERWLEPTETDPEERSHRDALVSDAAPLRGILLDWILGALEARRLAGDPIATGLLVDEADADTRTKSMIDEVDFPVSALVSYWRPGTLTRSACAVRPIDSASFATAGLRIITDVGAEVTTTVGHLGASTGDTVAFFHRGRLGRRHLRAGGVVVAVVEQLQRLNVLVPDRLHGKVDLAVVDVFYGDTGIGGDEVTVAAPETVEEFDSFGWFGARSDWQEQMLIGALRTIQMGDVRLARCWTLVGGSAPGDSGASVFRLDSNEFLGHVIGTVGRLARSGRRDVTVVQDGQLLIEAVREHTGGNVIEIRRAVLNERR